MKRFLALLLVALLGLIAEPALATISTPVVLGHTTGASASTNVITTSAHDCPVGALAVVGITWANSLGNTPSSVSDNSAGGPNSWTIIDSTTNTPGNIGMAMAYSVVTHDLAIGDTITTTYAGGVNSATVAACVATMGGVSAFPLDKHGNTASGTAGPSSTVSTGNLTQSTEIVFGEAGIITSGGVGTFTPGSGFTTLTGIGSGAPNTVELAYEIVSSSTSVNWSASWSNTSTGYLVDVASFQSGGIGNPIQTGQTAAATASGSSFSVSGGSVGDLIIVGVQCANSNATVSSISDSASNAYTKATATHETAAGASSEIWWAKATTVPSSITVNTSSGQYRAAAISVTGLSTSNPVDGTMTGVSSGSTSLSLSPGNLAQNQELAVGFVGFNTTQGTWTEGSGFTTLTSASPTSQWSYEITTTNSVTWAPSWVASVANASALATFTSPLVGLPLPIGQGTHTTTANTTVTLTTTSDCPAGALDVILASYTTIADTLSSVTDNSSGGPNSWTVIDNTTTTGLGLGVAYANVTHDIPSGGTITATFGGSTVSTITGSCIVSGIASSSPLDTHNHTATGTTSPATSVATGTLAQASEAVFGFLSTVTSSGTGTVTPGGSYSKIVLTQASVPGAAIAAQVVFSTSSVSWAPSWANTSTAYVTDVVSFKGAGTVVASATPLRTLMGVGGWNLPPPPANDNDAFKIAVGQ